MTNGTNPPTFNARNMMQESQTLIKVLKLQTEAEKEIEEL